MSSSQFGFSKIQHPFPNDRCSFKLAVGRASIPWKISAIPHRVFGIPFAK
jgi:hypothetical protein